MNEIRPDYRLLYRGSLSSCNYACDYCPFAKTSNSRQELQLDRQQLERFADWVKKQPTTFGLLFTPWGEALIRRYYRRVLSDLSWFKNVQRVAIQTHLGAPLSDFETANVDKIRFWATYHPSQTSLENFLSQCHWLLDRGFLFSVGTVGVKENFTAIDSLRRELPSNVYLWINAFKRETHYYTQEEKEFLTKIDPNFPINNRYHDSLGESCETGQSVFSIDGNGDIKRCHFVSPVMGNIYKNSFTEMNCSLACPNSTCGCHIGYVHLRKLKQSAIYGENLLERIPTEYAFDSPERNLANF